MKASLSIRLAARAAARDGQLRENLRRSTELSLEKRRKLVEDIPNYSRHRGNLAASRRESVRRMDSLLAEAVERLESAGIRCHLAGDAEEAQRLVLEICGDLRRIVKGKSMVSEEIGLNAALEAAGKEVVETDLGEYIVQLRGEAPSHITAPALHLNRRQIAELFERELGMEYSEDPETLTAAAREHLRDRFLKAQVGITGANFVVAETGTIILVENEGNIGLASTLPPVHIAVTGIEKILPRLIDADAALRLLPVNGTGQRSTAYVSFISSPAPEMSGPQEVHVIFLDNGRRRLAERGDARALACIRCGACLNVCPLFRRVGGHGYGSVYPGPIGILTTPFLIEGAEGHGLENSLADACSLCEACAEVCPAEIPLPDLIRGAREEKAAAAPALGRITWKIFGRLCAHPTLFRVAGWFARRLPASVLRGLTPAWSLGRALPRSSRYRFRTLLAERRRR